MGLTDNLPPFPGDVPTVPIARISYAKLASLDANEMANTLKAVQTDGFFYLDLADHATGQTLLKEAVNVLEVSQDAFNLSEEEKMKFRAEKGKSMFGYKPKGTVKKTDKDLRPDATEFFNIAKDHLLGNCESRTYPSQLTKHWEDLKTFTKDSHALGIFVLRILAGQLGIPLDSFADKNKIDSLSGDHIRITKKAPHDPSLDVIGLPSHTDFGSVTVLFNWLGGLQIQSHDPAKQGVWAFVKPLPGCAIINLGDAMVKFSNGHLKSAKHRVVPAPGSQAHVDRYSLVYFLRPADDVVMQPVERYRDEPIVAVGGKVGEEKVYTAGEWMTRRMQHMSK
ncbi:hypothetical protein NQ176_g1907 [Zarea fungicola]|uniref:Uncharacterized protein n=1 Tax=Zarea fungicola TaxID=93591 RepID=A0ACC1NRS5_9HYPO|nr:hypothetical protein NQ176_g1907 [Lecanicillium fungicola]